MISLFGGTVSMARPRRREEGGGGNPDLPVLSSRHRGILEKIYERPTRSDLTWREIVGLFHAAGGTVSHGSGSRRRFFLRGAVAVFHEPHPGNEVKKGAVEDIRDFLDGVGL